MTRRTRFYTFILLFSLLSISNVSYAQKKKEDKVANNTIENTKKTMQTDYKVSSRKSAWKQTAPKTTRNIVHHTIEHGQMKFPVHLKDTIIVKGAEVRIAFEFDKRVKYVEVIGIGRASKTDIKSGKWEVIVKPTRTTFYEYIIRGLGVDEKPAIIPYAGKGILVIVVDSEAEVEKTWEIYENEMGKKARYADWKKIFF